MYKYEDIKQVHLEITEKCQAGCSMCARNEGPNGSLLQHLTNAELSIEDCRSIFPKEFIKQLDVMYMCGNYGDPIMARDTLEVFEYFRYANPSMRLNMYTNAGARNSDWWRDLAAVMYSRGRVTFSVDGLEDTNHIYRENVQWDRVINAMESFIGAGGQAEWHFLVFKHNEHQVDEARELAKKLGFKNFIPKRTGRWPTGKSVYKHLEQAEKKEYVHRVNEFKAHVVKKFGSYDKFLNNTVIGCRVLKEKSVYVSAEGLVVPCCWIGGSAMYDAEVQDYKEGDIFKYIIDDKIDIDAKVHGIKGVFDSGFFEKIEKSWSAPSMNHGKLRTCAKTCSMDHDHFEQQFVKNYSL